jgi:hypothetical protein
MQNEKTSDEKQNTISSPDGSDILLLIALGFNPRN